MEVSSHALDQARVAAVRFDTGVFTNLSRDHLDYHGDMRAYGEAKRSLFHHPGLRCAVVNTDDAFGRALLAGLSPELEITGFQLENGNGTGDARRLYGCPVVRGRVLEAGRAGMRLRIDSPWGAGEMRSPLLGRFNASNLLAALGAVLGAGVPFATALERLGSLRAPPGRLECFGGGGLPLVVVDYAHTPDALERALQTLRATCAGALWCVFGCGGERDRGKRPLMGGVSAREADVIVLTDDNPRNEDGRLIIDDIQEGVPAGSRVMVERDRALAIRRAVCGAEPGDVVLVAGKGHEPYQDVAGARRSFSDAAEVRAALRERDR